jgi:predicted transposase YbfD/YdcC
MGCQKEIAADIVGRGGHYVLAAKENQPHLYEDIRGAFDKALDQGEPGVDFTECQPEEVRSGRHETRTCCVITDPRGIRNAGLGTGLTAIVMVISHRVVDGVEGLEIRSFIGSTAGTAEQYLRWVRGDWGIENSLHWVLDICFREEGYGQELCLGILQAAGFSLMPSMKTVPLMTSTSSGDPFNARQLFDADSISL